MSSTPLEPGPSYAVLTGPIVGVLTLDDGTQVNVSPPMIYLATQEQADEVADKIGKHWATGAVHPDHRSVDPVTGEETVAPFEYQAPEG